MPEGDTLARAARTLHEWLAGRELTGVQAREALVQRNGEELIGRTIDAVEARAKHLLITLGDRTIHSHMRMSGSWHVYEAGAKWRKSRNHMRLVLEAGDHIAVCFDAPIVQIVPTKDVDLIRGLNTLGLDILTGIDPNEGADRLASLPAGTPIGDALLDQTAVSGLGNIWRCEALWECGVHPRTEVAALDRATLARLVEAGATLMGASASVGGSRRPPEVYKRTGHPCRRCGAAIMSRRMGKDARTAYWCPNCQQHTE